MMPFSKFTSSNGLEFETETLSFGVRLPGHPKKRMFSCHVLSHNDTAEVKLAANFGVSMRDVHVGLGELLRSLGFKRVEYSHHGKTMEFTLEGE